jgi:hypothetical protein
LLVGLAAMLAAGCFTSVRDVSHTPPYERLVGRMFITRESGAIWINNQPAYQIRKAFIRFASWGDVPSYRTELTRVTEFPENTPIKIQSVKHKQVESEMNGFRGDIVLCLLELPSGQRIECQMDAQSLSKLSEKH